MTGTPSHGNEPALGMAHSADDPANLTGPDAQAGLEAVRRRGSWNPDQDQLKPYPLLLSNSAGLGPEGLDATLVVSKRSQGRHWANTSG